jgi:N6-adenosine-specific RNA methylase IME4
MKYNIILADPPWAYRTWKKQAERSVERHYEVMTEEDIKSLPVAGLAAEKSVLFLWITPPCLPQGIDTMRAWGFEYKTVAFTWVKTTKSTGGLHFGMGYYTRANCEYCLIGTRGSSLERKSKSVRQVIISQRREHSRKPDETRERIIDLFGDIPRIELFAREREKGWDAVGNDIDGKDIRNTLYELTKDPEQIYFPDNATEADKIGKGVSV